MWDKPNIETLVEFLNYHQHWEPSYIRQRIFPMLTTIYLREVASNPNESLLLYNQYDFDSIQRIKVRYDHPCYLVKWKKAIQSSIMYDVSSEQSEVEQMGSMGANGSNDMLDEPDVPLILVDNGSCFLLTDENMLLVQAAFPKEVDRFLEEKVCIISLFQYYDW